jgi:hypothetical protein
MKMTTLLVCLGTLTTALAAAASRYTIDFRNPALVAGTELKPGTYTMEVNGDKAMLQRGKQQVEVNVKMEEGSEKFSDTTVRYTMVDGKYHVAEIRLRGTKTKIVFANN